MPLIRNGGARTLAAALLLLTATATHAEWQPQWSTAWQYPASFQAVTAARVSVANDGSTFAAANIVRNSHSYVTLMKFDAAGTFVWLQEREAGLVSGIAFINGQVAIAGEGGTVAAPIYVSLYDALTGELVWNRQVAGGRTFIDGLNDNKQLAVDANGNLMLLVSDHGDYVVVRFDPDGNALPTWRRTIDPERNVLATGIVASPDGGATLTGQGREIGGGFVSVRLDAQGNEVFTDVDLGDIGNPLGSAYLALAADGSVFVAASPESFGGVPRAQVRKLSSSGAQIWTRALPQPGNSTSGTKIRGLVLADNGDALVEIASLTSPFRVLRLAAVTGDVVWDVGVPISGDPTALLLAPSGRVLVGSRGDGHESGHIAELDADGNACRVANSLGMFSNVLAAAGSTGWSVLGTTQFIPGSSRDAFVSHFDGSGACTMADLLFEDGFDF